MAEKADHHDPGDQAEQSDREQETFFERINPAGFIGDLLIHSKVAIGRGSQNAGHAHGHRVLRYWSAITLPALTLWVGSQKYTV